MNLLTPAIGSFIHLQFATLRVMGAERREVGHHSGFDAEGQQLHFVWQDQLRLGWRNSKPSPSPWRRAIPPTTADRSPRFVAMTYRTGASVAFECSDAESPAKVASTEETA